MLHGVINSFPPTLNNLYKFVTMGKGKRKFTKPRLTTEGATFKTRAGVELGRQWMFLDPPPDNTPLVLTVDFYFPALYNKGWPSKAATKFKKKDVDNYLKLVIDIVKEASGVDDSNIVALHAYKFEDKARPRIEVYIGEFHGRSESTDETGAEADSLGPAGGEGSPSSN